MDYQWIVLIYKIPPEPSKHRATVWREIKRLGGVYLQNGVAIFPDIDDVALNVSALALQVRGMNGSEYMFFTHSPTQGQSDELIEMFQSARAAEYTEIAQEISSIEERVQETVSQEDIQEVFERLKKLIKQVGSIKARDYFNSPQGVQTLAVIKELQLKIQKLQREGLSR